MAHGKLDASEELVVPGRLSICGSELSLILADYSLAEEPQSHCCCIGGDL